MISETFVSNKSEPKEAAFEISKKASKSNIDPDFAFFYSTLKYHGNFDCMLGIIKNTIGDIPQIGGTVDGFITPSELRADGAVLVLCEDSTVNVEAIPAKDLSVKDSIKQLSEKIEVEDGAVLLHFPLFYISGKGTFLKTVAKGKYYDLRCRGSQRSKIKYAGKFSNYLNKNSIFYPPSVVLSQFSNKLNLPVIGINLGHSGWMFDSPNVFCNFKNVKNRIAALVLDKKGVNTIYDDIFPSKENVSLRNTNNNTNDNNQFKILREFESLKKDNILISLDGKPPMEAINKVINILKIDEEELEESFEKGSLSGESPYILFFRNEETKGLSFIGVSDVYPFDFYPSYMNFEDFSNYVFFGYEPSTGKFLDYVSSLQHLEDEESFTFSIIDVASISTFGDNVRKYVNEFEKTSNKNYFSIFSMSPSVYLPKKYWNYDYLPEVKENILFAGAGANISLEI